MSDEVIRELWQIKDLIAWEHGYDIEVLVAHLQDKEKAGDQQEIAGLRATTEAPEPNVPGGVSTSSG